MTNTVNLKIDGIDITAEQGSSILEAAKILNIKIPTFCYHEDLCLVGKCRICVVEQIGETCLVPSCSTEAKEGMEILTNTSAVINIRKQIVESLLFEHNINCTMCYKNSAFNYRHLIMKE